MSGREWQPGDVAVATVRGVPNVRIMRTGDRRPLWRSAVVGGVGIDSMAWHSESSSPQQVTDIRPLVVIDPEDRAEVERVRDALLSAFREQNDLPLRISVGVVGNALQAALRSLITPPKPEEPTGLGAVIEDADSARWVRVNTRLNAPWRQSDGPHAGRFRSFALVDAVRILSEGVQ